MNPKKIGYEGFFSDSSHSFACDSIEDDAVKSEDALGEKKGQMFYMFDDVSILDRV